MTSFNISVCNSFPNPSLVCKLFLVWMSFKSVIISLISRLNHHETKHLPAFDFGYWPIGEIFLHEPRFFTCVHCILSSDKIRFSRPRFTDHACWGRDTHEFHAFNDAALLIVELGSVQSHFLLISILKVWSNCMTDPTLDSVSVISDATITDRCFAILTTELTKFVKVFETLGHITSSRIEKFWLSAPS